MRRLHVRRLLRPGQRQRLRDGGGAVLLHERDEIEQSLAGVMQRESQIAPHAHVLLHRLPQGGHRAPPGHGNVSVRNAWRSTLA
jgi:hypothetical protein